MILIWEKYGEYYIVGNMIIYLYLNGLFWVVIFGEVYMIIGSVW